MAVGTFISNAETGETTFYRYCFNYQNVYKGEYRSCFTYSIIGYDKLLNQAAG